MWRDAANLLDMLIHARKAVGFVAGVSRDEFLRNDMMQQAVMRVLQIVGEAAWKVSDQYKAEHSEIPWGPIVGFRHRLVHDYVRINVEKVWQVLQADVPELIGLLEPLVPPEEQV